MQKKGVALLLWFFLGLSVISLQTQAFPIDVNTASAERLADGLVGIGPKKAEAIVKHREQHGDFKSLEALEAVPGIGKKTIEKNKERLLLNSP